MPFRQRRTAPDESQLALHNMQASIDPFAVQLHEHLEYWADLYGRVIMASGNTKPQAELPARMYRELGMAMVANFSVWPRWPSRYQVESARRKGLGNLAMSEILRRSLDLGHGLVGAQKRIPARRLLDTPQKPDGPPNIFTVHLRTALAKEIIGSTRPGWYYDEAAELYAEVAPSEFSPSLVQEIRENDLLADPSAMTAITPYWATRARSPLPVRQHLPHVEA